MQPILYIHLGQQKTGTTSLQRFCTRNRKELAERYGLLYPSPEAICPEGPHHRHFSLFPFQRDSWTKLRREVDASGCMKVLLSNEDLSMTGIDDASFASIRALFPEFTIKYIMYVRRIDDACKAWYMQSVKRNNMRDMSYETYVSNRDSEASHRLYPSGLLKVCEEQVGRENLILKLYDREQMLNNNTVDDIFFLMGIDLPASMHRDRPFNRGIPPEALPLITDTLRRYAINDPTRREIYNKLIEAFKQKNQCTLPEHIPVEVEKEIERMESFIPGYKELFQKKKLDFSFPKSDISPQELLIIDLLYTILFELRKKKTLMFHLSAYYKSRITPIARSAADFASDAAKKCVRSLLGVVPK